MWWSWPSAKFLLALSSNSQRVGQYLMEAKSPNASTKISRRIRSDSTLPVYVIWLQFLGMYSTLVGPIMNLRGFSDIFLPKYWAYLFSCQIKHYICSPVSKKLKGFSFTTTVVIRRASLANEA